MGARAIRRAGARGRACVPPPPLPPPAPAAADAPPHSLPRHTVTSVVAGGGVRCLGRRATTPRCEGGGRAEPHRASARSPPPSTCARTMVG
eukprot:6898564-Prymnesium_polylepis.1